MTTLILNGIAGCGKTTIGTLLAKQLNYKFIDTDIVIQNKYNQSVATIIKKYGIKTFRLLEQQTIKQLFKTKLHNTVIALGGGSFNNLINQKLCLKYGTVIWLNISPNIIQKHYLTKKNIIDRPLLSNTSINILFNKRKNNYAKSHITLNYSKYTNKKIIIKDIINSLNYTKTAWTINVNTTNKYSIINNNLIFSNYLAKYFLNTAYNKIIIVTDTKLPAFYLLQILSQFNNYNIKFEVIKFTAIEKNKSLKKAFNLLNSILKHKINKNTAILAIGGGVVQDVSGFCASVLLRGLPIFYMPTTLLSMVDSSIGGKNGVNTMFGKNTVGLIYQPKAIFIDYIWLHSLPKNQIESGYYECFKYGILFSKDFLEYTINNKNNLIQLNKTSVNNIIYNSVIFKTKVIEEDELEINNTRYLLNLGHTLGHALEKYVNYNSKLTHGYAVAIGIYFIAKLSNYLSLLNNTSANYIINNLPFTNLRYILPKKLSINKIINLMLQDKKNYTLNSINLVLIKDIANCIFVKNVNIQDITIILNKEFN